jgi:hypothetical protein
VVKAAAPNKAHTAIATQTSARVKPLAVDLRRVVIGERSKGSLDIGYASKSTSRAASAVQV